MFGPQPAPPFSVMGGNTEATRFSLLAKYDTNAETNIVTRWMNITGFIYYNRIRFTMIHKIRINGKMGT